MKRRLDLLNILRLGVVDLVRRGGPDLSVRQIAVLLLFYLNDAEPTLGNMVAQTGASRPSLSKSLSQLERAGLLRRTVRPADRRMTLVLPTTAGLAYMQHIRDVLAALSI